MGSFFGGPSVPQAPALSTFDPFSAYRPQFASQLANFMGNPSAVMGLPGYSQQLQAGTRATTAGLAATGGLMSGGELAQLNLLGQNTFGQYYDKLYNQLGVLSGGTTVNPSQAAGAQYGAQVGAQQQQYLQNQSTLGNILGIGGLVAGGFAGAPGQYLSGLFGSGGQTPTSGQIASNWGMNTGGFGAGSSSWWG